MAFVHILSWFSARFNIASTWSNMMHHKKIQRIAVALVILISAIIRLWVIIKMPITPSSDYQTYYQVADLLSRGLLSSSGYSGYIAQFPHVIGYSFILSLLFRITGPSVMAGLYLNMAASLISVYLTYRIARALSGCLGGMIALLSAAFWPSQILNGTLLASDPVFTCMLLLSVWLFIYLYRYPVSLGNREGAIFLSSILGLCIALAGAVRPMALIFLVAVVLSMIPFSKRFNKNEKMLNGKVSRASCQGWFLVLVISLVFLIFNQLLSTSISNAIGYKLPGSGVSFGYNFMVGMNTEAKGTWNQQDADFFTNKFALTDSSQEAHKAGIDVALQRIKADPEGILYLFPEKFSILWGNDGYAVMTTFFLDQQGILTRERQDIIGLFTKITNYFYLFSVFFLAVLGIQLFRRKDTGPEQALILLFIGTVILHLILETQNRYHYFILPIFMILTAMSIVEIYQGYVRGNRMLPTQNT
jgi:4-amino-4-deoxy-L-arabinose transferase-like glycosyltransferase